MAESTSPIEPLTDPPTDPPTSENSRRRAWVAGLVLIVFGGIWLAHLLGVPIAWPTVLAGGLVVVGVGVLFGGTRAADLGLVGVGTWLAIIALVATFAPLPSGFGVGQREHTITDLTQFEDRYGLLAGEVDLDLRQLELAPGTTTLTVDVVLGQTTIRVPEDVTVRGAGRALAGEVDILGEVSSGLLPNRNFEAPSVATTTTTTTDAVLELELRVGLGQIEVLR